MPDKEDPMSPYDSSLALAEPLPDVAASGADQITLETRFGTFEIDPARAIEMPQGPIGFAEMHRFALLDAPDAAEGPFKLYQSLDDPGLTFVVVPLAEESEVIDAADLDAACEAYCIARTDAAFLLIATFRPSAEGKPETTVNLKAPIVLDTRNLVARQVVFSGERYPMRQPLG